MHDREVARNQVNLLAFIYLFIYFYFFAFLLRCHSVFQPIAMFLVTSPIVINVPTRELLAVETKSSFV